MDTVKAKINKLNADIANCKKEAEQSQDECKKWKAKCDELEKQKEDVERKLTLITSDLESAENRLYAAKETIDLQEKQLDDTQRDVNIKALNAKYEQAISDLEAADEKNKDLQQKLRQTEEDRDTAIRTLKRTEGDLEKAESQLQNAEEAKDSLDQELNSAKNEIQSQKAEIERQETQTALHKAAWYGYRGICKILVEAEASLLRTDYQGNTPYLKSIENEDIKLQEYLRRKETDQKMKFDMEEIVV